MSLQQYQESFSNLRPNRSSGHGKPHKACLLLAVIDLIENGALLQNKIPFDQALKDAFSERFERYRQGNDRDNPANPYFYLTSSGFWQLHPNSGFNVELEQRLMERKSPSDTSTSKLINYASLDEGLYQLLQDPGCRAVLAGELEGTLLTNEESFRLWCRAIGKSDKTISDYVDALSSGLTDWISDSRGQPLELLQLTDSREVLGVREELVNYEIYRDRDRVEKGRYSAALKLYERYLVEGSRQARINTDIEELKRRDLDGTVRETLVNARRGQGLFRNRVLDQWYNRCAITGYNAPKFLLASHMKPWKDSSDQERLDRFNGFALIPSLDKAFDMGYISFKSTGEIMISTELEEPETLGIFESQSVTLHKRHQPYLEFHRAELFLG